MTSDEFPSSEELRIPRLGEALHDSPIETLFVPGDEGIVAPNRRSQIRALLAAGEELPFYELAGPRRKLFFRPEETTCALVTCGGLCPGLNDVIRGITMLLERGYGVRRVLGLRYGYQGLVPRIGHEPLHLTAESVSEIHRRGGTVLKSSRDRQDPEELVDGLEALGIDCLFTIGGDGTQRGACAIVEALRRRGRRVAVVGIPKTIDNDIPHVGKSFGFETAVGESVRVVNGGHIEAHDNPCGVALIQLMGRDAGFIAAAASVASGDVDFCLVPEVPFAIGAPRGLLDGLEARLRRRAHAVIVVAEGAGAAIVDEHVPERGTARGDVGLYLRDRILEEMPKRGFRVTLKYIDPSYAIRSVPATPDDSVYCARLAADAVHGALSGRTGMVIGWVNDAYVHVPMRLVTSGRRQLDPRGPMWRAVLESTGQPASLL